MENVRDYGVALTESHRQLFTEECSRLTVLICDCLNMLENNPSDLDAIEKMVNAADVIRGGAKFLQNVELEQSAKLLIELFKGVQDIRERQNGFDMVCDLFNKMARQMTLQNF